MGKFYLAIIAFLFITSSSFALDFQSTPTRLTGFDGTYDTGNGIGRLNGFYYNGNFYIMHTKVTMVTYCHIDKYAFGALGTSLGTASLLGINYGDCSINYFNSTHGLAFGDTGQTQRNAIFFRYSDLALTTAWSDGDTHLNSCGGTSNLMSWVTKEGVVINRALDCDVNRYYLTNAETDIYFPTGYGDVKDLSLVYNEANAKYYLFTTDRYIEDNGAINVYSSSALNQTYYLSTQRFTEDLQTNICSLSVAYKNGYIYENHLINNSMLQPYTADRITVFGLSDSGSLVEIETQLVTIPNVVSGTNYTGSSFLMYADGVDTFYLIYNVYNSTTKNYLNSWILQEDNCARSSWVSQGCEGKYEKFNRTISPVGCDSNTTYYIASYSCEKDYNRSLGIYEQGFEWWSEESSCSSGWLKEGEARCNPNPIDIPSDCTNITAFEYTVAGFNTGGWFPTLTYKNKGNMTIKSCTPAYNCTSKTLDCYLVTSENDTVLGIQQDNYKGGDVATGLSSLTVPFTCLKNSWLSYGIDQYTVGGSIAVSCIRPCIARYECSEDYSIYYEINCEPKTKTYCDNLGCNKDTGQCNLSINDNEKYSISGIFKFFLSPTPMQKGIQAILGIIIMAIIGTAFTSAWKLNSEAFILTFIGLGWVFFTIIGYLPVILTIIIVFFVGIGFWLKNK